MAVTFDKPATETERPRKVAFTYDDEDYTVFDTFTAAEGMLLLNQVRKYGLDAATDWALEYALGTQGYSILMALGARPEFEEQWQQVVAGIVSDMSGGRFEVEYTGKAPKAATRSRSTSKAAPKRRKPSSATT